MTRGAYVVWRTAVSSLIFPLIYVLGAFLGGAVLAVALQLFGQGLGTFNELWSRVVGAATGAALAAGVIKAWPKHFNPLVVLGVFVGFELLTAAAWVADRQGYSTAQVFVPMVVAIATAGWALLVAEE